MITYMFPGQGSQAVGMAKSFVDEFAVARHVLDEVDDALSQRLSRLMFEGPASELSLTSNTQPAIMAASLAVWAVMKQELGHDVLIKSGAFMMGHSLGEYSALAAADSVSVSQAAQLLRTRGNAMQDAVKPEEGAMAAILGLSLEDAEAVAAQAAGDGVCVAANDNAPGQVVLSGDADAVERALVLAKEKGARRAVMLDVSAPFHSPLMKPAAAVMSAALESETFNAPSLPIICNVTTEAEANVAALKENLVEQVTGRVRWRESVQVAADQGVTTLVEVGHGNVLSGLARRINKELKAVAVQSPADLDAFGALLK